MIFDFLTLFPEVMWPYLRASIFAKAVERGVVQCDVLDFREFSRDPDRRVDDLPYGGGQGMVLRPEPLVEALSFLRTLRGDRRRHIVLTAAWGHPFTQQKAEELAQSEQLIFICGHYEGIDERVVAYCTDVFSIGPYVLTGGELPALVIADAVLRMLPGSLGNAASAKEESFSAGRLEYPQYTRPRVYQEEKVPDVLLSGNHSAIETWRKRQALLRTLRYRPALLQEHPPDEQELQWLKEEQDSGHNCREHDS